MDRPIDRVCITKIAETGEYRVNRLGSPAVCASFQMDLEDAIGTGNAEWPTLPIYFRGREVFAPLPRSYEIAVTDSSGDVTYCEIVAARDLADMVDALNCRDVGRNVLVENGCFDERQKVTAYALDRSGTRIGVAMVARPAAIPGRTLFIVSADHTCPEWRLERATIEVREYPQGPGAPILFYANARGFGCGKNARTPEEAIRSLLLDSACRNIRIERAS